MIPRPSPFHPRPTHRRHAAAPLRAGVAAVLIAVSVALTGCTPGAAPKPTPTPLFTSEADAFRAAEQVYRAYVEAGNERRASNDGIDPQSFLAGQALEDDINAQRMFREKHLKVVGPNKVSSFRPLKYDEARGQVSADLCVDVTESRVVNESGTDVTPSARVGVVAVEVEMTSNGQHLVITGAIPGKRSCIS